MTSQKLAEQNPAAATPRPKRNVCPHCGNDLDLSRDQVRLAKELAEDLVTNEHWSQVSAQEYAEAAMRSISKRYIFQPRADKP